MSHKPLTYQAKIVNVTCGENTKIIEPANLYDCFLGSDCFVGPFVEIQKGVKIGDRCKIQSHSFICELVTIGNDCFIGHGVMFVNDKFSEGGPAQGKKELWGHITIADHTSIGSNATILPVSICANVVIGAGSVVTKNITESGVYAGNPAKKIK
jgi:acetyltransferase-like isoleucine patch superfamily enzyme